MLSDRQRAFLDGRRFATLATVEPDGSPHLTAMWYLLEGDEIVFNTARERRKVTNLTRDPRVALLVLDGYTFVRVEGRARLSAQGPDALADIHRLAVRYDGEESAARAMERFRTQERLSYRFRIADVYASSDLR